MISRLAIGTAGAWLCAITGSIVVAADDTSSSASAFGPVKLSLLADQPESIYAPAELQEDQAVNAGGVHFDLTVTSWTDYIFRGIDRSESGGSEDSPNLQFDGAMRFDLGRYPDFILGVFTNIYNSDPISRFQEIRPYFALQLNARPFTFTAGNTFYIYPERDQYNTAELFARLALDDSYFFHSDDPILQPYVLAAFDYDVNQGLYLEVGIRHDFQIEDTKLVLSPTARVAYVNDNKMFRAPVSPVADPGFTTGTSGKDSGFQHYEIGVEATYMLNQALNIPARYGRLDFKAYLFYTDGISNQLRADSELYGGVGIGFSY